MGLKRPICTLRLPRRQCILPVMEIFITDRYKNHRRKHNILWRTLHSFSNAGVTNYHKFISLTKKNILHFCRPEIQQCSHRTNSSHQQGSYLGGSTEENISLPSQLLEAAHSPGSWLPSSISKIYGRVNLSHVASLWPLPPPCPSFKVSHADWCAQLG